MLKIVLEIDGMMCGMCEAHINDAIRNAFPVEKVTSSHAKGRVEILTEASISNEALKAAITETGYDLKSIAVEPYKRTGLFRKK